MDIVKSLNLVKTIKDWQHHEFLRKNGCKTQAEYDRRYDPDFEPRADTSRNIYKGYKHCWPYQNEKHVYFEYHMACEEMIKWCKQNCKDKWRHDWHRVIYDQYRKDWCQNGIGGSDFVFFAFKSSSDYTMFLLKWGSY